jgi:hypothetical protein
VLRLIAIWFQSALPEVARSFWAGAGLAVVVVDWRYPANLDLVRVERRRFFVAHGFPFAWSIFFRSHGSPPRARNLIRCSFVTYASRRTSPAAFWAALKAF